MSNKKAGGVLFLIVSVVAIYGAWAQSSGDEKARATSTTDRSKLVLELQQELQRIPLLRRSSPRAVDTSAENWRAISDGVGLWLFTDGAGVRRATLYVRSDDDSWHPVALEGLAELGPELLPAGSS